MNVLFLCAFLLYTTHADQFEFDNAEVEALLREYAEAMDKRLPEDLDTLISGADFNFIPAKTAPEHSMLNAMTTTELPFVTAGGGSDSGDHDHVVTADGGDSDDDDCEDCNNQPEIHVRFDYPAGNAADEGDEKEDGGHDSSESKDTRSGFPEWNGEDIIGKTDTYPHAKWSTKDYEPLAHSFAYDYINCENLRDDGICEINCRGLYSCYKTTVNGKDADYLELNCLGEKSCHELKLHNVGGAVNITCSGEQACSGGQSWPFTVDVDDTDLTMSCQGEGACYGASINRGSMKDMPGYIARKGSFDLKCGDSTDMYPACRMLEAGCPHGTDTCEVECGPNACVWMNLFVGSVDDGADDVQLTCDKSDKSCDHVSIACVNEDHSQSYWETTTLGYAIPDGGNFVSGKEWFCESVNSGDGCCPPGLATGDVN